MPIRYRLPLLLVTLWAVAAPVHAAPVIVTDWGGGYLRGPDSATTTVAISGAGSSKPVAIIVAPAPLPASVPLTDWGGGYWRGPDSASTTVATSGAGTPKPN